jgi:hypothetical protein
MTLELIEDSAADGEGVMAAVDVASAELEDTGLDNEEVDGGGLDDAELNGREIDDEETGSGQVM